MNFLENIVNAANDALYTYILVVLLVLGGLYFSLRTRFMQFRLLGEQIKSVTEKPSDKKGVSSFQALMVSTASRVGTGNIIGVSVAICVGGFGSVFWMWLIAILGSATSFVESTLAQIYKKKGENGYYGGPAYYIEAVTKNRVLPVIFSICLMLTYAFGFNMLASYNLQSTFETYAFYNADYTKWIIGGIVAVAVGYCLFGGGKRIVKVTSLLVPFMGLAYILVALLIVLLNITALPSVFAAIFKGAFDFKAIFGGIAGSALMQGVKRGLFSNEAGVGSAPNASAVADVSHPVKQGMVQTLSVFLDTLLVCSATAFMCMCSGIAPEESIKGAPYIQASLSATLGDFGPIFITAAMILFAFTTLLGNLYYVDQALIYLLKREPGKWFMRVYHLICALIVFVGAGLSADLLWGIADVTMGAMALINIPIILYLGKYAFRALKDYEKQRREGKNPVFRASSVGLEGKVECWQDGDTDSEIPL